ncbi:hypothetical protein D3C86_1924650 [compost metagenome]
MTDYLVPSKVLELICYIDEVNLEHGATPIITDPTTDSDVPVDLVAQIPLAPGISSSISLLALGCESQNTP